jgi:hypothetical protein
MQKNSHRRKNNPIDGEKNPSHGKFYAILHKFCQRLKKIHEFRINLSIVSKKFMNLDEFYHRWEKTCNLGEKISHRGHRDHREAY